MERKIENKRQRQKETERQRQREGENKRGPLEQTPYYCFSDCYHKNSFDKKEPLRSISVSKVAALIK